MLKELVSLIGKEQTKDLLEWLNGKTTFIYNGCNEMKELSILEHQVKISVPFSNYLLDDFFDYLNFTLIYADGQDIYYKHKPFDAQPYLQILKDL